MKRNKYILLILYTIITFSCNNQANESKTQTNIDNSKKESNMKQIEPNSIEVSEQNNFPTKPTTIPTNTSKHIITNSENLKVLYKKLEKTPQVFSIATTSDTTITCSEGTKITFKEKSFISEKTGTEILGHVQISVKEYYKLSDIILAKLSTTSGNNILETGGMIYITATSDNQSCVLKQGQSFEIEFPSKIQKEGMQLYIGDWKNENQIDWTLDKNSTDLDTVFSFVDLMPSLPGGMNFSSYLDLNIEYPERALELGIQGKVIISFVIDKKGNVTNAKVIKGIDKECDQVALDAINKLPRFNVGKLNGEAVNVNLIVPIEFNLDDKGSTKNIDIKKNFEKKYNDTTILKAGISAINSYVLRSTELGWINCDRLWENTSESAVNYGVNINGGQKAILNIVFHRYKSLLNGYTESNRYLFQRIPANEKITLVAIKYIDNKLYLALKETQTSSQIENDLVFQPVTMEAFKNELQKLDKFN